MSKLDKLQKAKRELWESEYWAKLLGAPYYGGVPRGSVEFGYVYSVALANVVIYNQPNPGDQNYHDVPKGLVKHLEAAIKKQFKSILADAMAAQQAELKQIVAEAAAEYKHICETAGIELGEPKE